MGEVADRITKNLEVSFEPQHLELKDISHLHEGHAGHDGRGESHFKLLIVCDVFEGKSKVERHRMVYDVLNEELEARVHALSVKALTTIEYQSAR